MTRKQKRSSGYPKKKASIPAKYSRPASSFEFSVASEEGINLFVDLNSTVVDWHKSLENGICICRCLEENKFKSFREELLYLGNSRKQIEDSLFLESTTRIKSDSYPCSFNKASENSLLNHPDAGSGPLEIFAAEACSFAQEESEPLKQQRENPVSISSNSFVKVTKSSPRREEIESMDPNAFHIPQGKIASCSSKSLVAVQLQTTLNDKNTKLHDEISANVKVEKGWNPLNVKPHPVSSVTTAVESKLLEVVCLENDTACSSFVNDPLLNLIDAAHSMEKGLEELANSVEIENLSHLTVLSAEEQASGVNGTEASCKPEKRTDEFMSVGGLKQKICKSQSNKVSIQFSGRVLRSAARPRRSPRFISKGVTPF